MSDYPPCPNCDGEGDCPECGNEPLENPEDCGECSGDLVCPYCGGTGEDPSP